jgi:predicted phage terminase large subunit-like protein
MVAAVAHPRTDPLIDLYRVRSREDLRTSAARDSLRWFTARMFPGYQTAPHILTLIAEIEQAVATSDSRLIITMPPRHSKSLHVSENLPAWYLGRNPDHRVIGASHTQELANTFSRRVRNKISDPRYPFPAVAIAGDKAAVKAWDIDGHYGGYYAVGVGGSPTGHGANLIIIDDPIKNQADADSETVRDALWEWYTGTIRTRLEPGGSIIVTATRWHDDDLTGRLIAAEATGGEAWRHIHMPALSGDGEALWPGRWPVAALEATRSAVGSRVWQAQYQGNPQATEGGTFKRHWWRRYAALPEDISRVEVTVDSAFKTGVANDFTAMAAWAADRRGNAYLVRCWRERVEFPELIGLGMTAWQWTRDRFPGMGVPLVVEDKASGQSAIQVWKRENRIPVIAHPVKANESKIARAEATTPYVEGGRVFIPEYAPWLPDWLDEHDRFPTGAHDDQVDTTAMAVSRLLTSGGWGIA